MPFILLLIGVALIVYNSISINKDKKKTEIHGTFSGELKSADKDMNEFNIEIGKLRIDFAETITELQREIQNLKEEKEEKEKNSDVYIESDIISEENTNSIKIKKVEELLNKNFTIDEISKELNIGKGEVLLIKKLYSD